MPIHEFECGGCGKRFERLVSGREDADCACPHCGDATVRRLPSVFAVTGGSGVRPGGTACGSGTGGDDCACRRN